MKDSYTGLMGAYGYEEEFSDRVQCLTRYQGEHTFIDIWDGRKGVTVGVYDPEKKSMWYERKCSLEDLEEILIELKNNEV